MVSYNTRPEYFLGTGTFFKYFFIFKISRLFIKFRRKLFAPLTKALLSESGYGPGASMYIPLSQILANP